VKGFNTVGYTALTVVFAPVQILLGVIMAVLEIVMALVRLAQIGVQAFLVWLMPEEIKAKLLALHKEGRL